MESFWEESKKPILICGAMVLSIVIVMGGMFVSSLSAGKRANQDYARLVSQGTMLMGEIIKYEPSANGEVAVQIRFVRNQKFKTLHETWSIELGVDPKSKIGESVPVYYLPKNKQIDAATPYSSAIQRYLPKEA